MPEEPTLPEIIRALTKVNDRHQQALHDQSESFRDQLRVKDNKIDSQRRALATCDRTLGRREDEIEFLREVIGELCHRIERAQSQLRRDNQNCVYPEPLEIMDLLGRETDPGKVIKILRDRKDRAARQKMTPCPNFVQNPEPEKPNVPCSLHKGHAGYCIVKAPENPRPCPLRIVEDCAGTEGHPGPCTPNADDIPSAQEAEDPPSEPLCVHPGCGHPEVRHTESLPEEGRRKYCTECSEHNEFHAFVSGN